MKKDYKNKLPALLNKFKGGNFDDVILEATSLLNKTPDDDFLWNLKGMAYQSKGDNKNSLNCFSKASQHNPNNYAAMNNLGNSLKYLHKFDEAEKCFKNLLEKNPNYLNCLMNLGNLKKQTFHFDQAIKYYELFIEKNDKIPQVFRNLGVTYQILGQMEKAKESFSKILKLDENFTEADNLLSAIINHNEIDDHLNTMLNKLENFKLNNKQKIQLYFGISKEYEDKKDYAKSAKFLKLGNNLQKKITNTPFDINIITKITESIKSCFLNFNYEKSITDDKKKIFIVGLPRSGTTLVEKIISGHPMVSSLGELNLVPQLITDNFFVNNSIDLIKIKNIFKINIDENYQNIVKFYKTKNEIIVDKTLTNFWYIGFIKILFPNSKIIHCTRDPKDNCLSIYKNLFSSSQSWCYNEEDIFNYHKSYEDIMSFWNMELKGEFFNIKYEDLINDFSSETKKMIKFCDLEWDDNCLDFYKNDTPITTLSVNQANKPIYNTSINSSKNYDHHLKDLFSKFN